MIVYVETLCGGRPQGKILNPYLAEGVPYSGIDGLVLCVNKICDRINYPQSAFEFSSFSESGDADAESAAEGCDAVVLDRGLLLAQRGAFGTLSISVLYRQYGGLQGQLVMNVGHRVQKTCFRSTLELMSLLDEAFPTYAAGQ